MKQASSPHFTRRKFTSLAAGFGGAALSAPLDLRGSISGVAETNHFWYRLAPSDGPYIDTQRGSKAFGFRDRKLFFSNDNAATWSAGTDFPNADEIMFSAFLANGNLVFATLNRLYLSTDNLESYREIIVKDRDGSDYLPHQPTDPEKPGSYFYSLDGIHTHEVEGREMLIWGNYCNVRKGAVPVNIYYSTDHGETVKIAYSFGQNSAFQQAGAEPPSFLGDPDNSQVCRHVHSVSYNSAENAFYACTGDLDRNNGHGLECHWLRGIYDRDTDAWEWITVVSADANSRFKSGGINFSGGEVYWVADANGPKTLRETYDRGVFRCEPRDIADKSKHTVIFPARYEIAVMTIENDFIVIPEYGPANPCDCGILFSPDLGKTWGQYDLRELGVRSGVRVNHQNSDGWFRMCLREKWMDRAEVLFIKPKRVTA